MILTLGCKILMRDKYNILKTEPSLTFESQFCKYASFWKLNLDILMFVAHSYFHASAFSAPFNSINTESFSSSSRSEDGLLSSSLLQFHKLSHSTIRLPIVFFDSLVVTATIKSTFESFFSQDFSCRCADMLKM